MVEIDPFDEFEMKPLTEGLGFHKKAVKLKDTVKTAKLLDEELSSGLPSSIPNELLEENKGSQKSSSDILAEIMQSTDSQSVGDLNISETLPRKSAPVTPTMELPEVELPEFNPTFETPSIPETEAIKNPQIKSDFKESAKTRRGAADSQRTLKPVPFSVASLFVDSLTVLAFAMLFLVSLVLATGVDFFLVLQNAQSDLMVQVSMGVLYVTIYQMYIIVARSFFGKSLGEWTFDLQLGRDQQIKRVMYPAMVLWRSLVIIATGIVLLPLLSIITRRDITSYLTGLQLYKK